MQETVLTVIAVVNAQIVNAKVSIRLDRPTAFSFKVAD